MAAVVMERGSASDPLRLLAIVHVVWALSGLLGLGVTAVFGVTTWEMYDPAYIDAHGEPLPDFIMMFVPLMKAWIFVVAASQIAMMGLNVAVARARATRRRWWLCATVSGLNWISIPLGPVLGTWTLVVLNRPAVRAAFS